MNKLMPEYSNQEWVRLVKQRDPAAMELLWQQTIGWCLILARRYNQDDDVGYTAAVQTMRRIEKYLHTYQGKGSFLGWCRQTAINRVKDRLPPPDRPREVNLEALPLSQESTFDPEPQATASELRQRLQPCLDQLNARRREVIDKLYFQELSPQEVADQTGSTRGSITKLAFDARRELLDCLIRRGFTTLDDILSFVISAC